MSVSPLCFVQSYFDFFHNSFPLIDDGRWPSVEAKHCELELEGLQVCIVKPGRRQRHFDTLANGFSELLNLLYTSAFSIFWPVFYVMIKRPYFCQFVANCQASRVCFLCVFSFFSNI